MTNPFGVPHELISKGNPTSMKSVLSIWKHGEKMQIGRAQTSGIIWGNAGVARGYLKKTVSRNKGIFDFDNPDKAHVRQGQIKGHAFPMKQVKSEKKQ